MLYFPPGQDSVYAKYSGERTLTALDQFLTEQIARNPLPEDPVAEAEQKNANPHKRHADHKLLTFLQ